MMVFKNLIRRKGRTILTVLSIGIGVYAIILISALADGMGSGYSSMITGTKADLVLNQPNTLEISMAAIDESAVEQLERMPEVSKVSGMVQGIVTADESPYFFVFGYPEDSFILERFQVTEGHELDSIEAQRAKGTPLILGKAAAEALNKEVGDSIRITSTAFRIVGIYETGSAFEDGGGVIPLGDAQMLLGRQRQVNVVYIQIKDPSLADRLITRADRLWPELDMSTTGEYSDSQFMDDAMNVYVVMIAGMAIVIGGVAIANSQLMAVYERTREIGVLRAIGWSSRRVMQLIFSESILVSLLGGFLGLILGILTLSSLSAALIAFGASTDSITPALLLKAFVVVVVLGIVGGILPARRAAQLEPVEALRYEGGSTGAAQKRLPFGGMAVQSLYQRTTRTLLTAGMIALTIASIMTLEGFIEGAKGLVNGMAENSGAEIVLRQADLSDLSQSIIDEVTLNRIEALPEVEATSGFIFSAVGMPETLFFMVQGMEPNNFGIRRFKIVDGEPLRSNRQIIIGRTAADAMNKEPGDTIEVGGSRFKIVGIYDINTQWENTGGVVTLRDGQIIAGRPRKVTMANVKVYDPRSADEVVEIINARFDDVHASLSGEFADQLPDMEAADQMLGAISIMALLIGGFGIMNTMLMAVHERTKEIGALRALGWRQRDVLTLIMKEAFYLGIFGGLIGIPLAVVFTLVVNNLPIMEDFGLLTLHFSTFLRAIFVALFLGAIGGIYPAWRATKMLPVEALRYE
jgi:ABC-type lipoprotein release transport system permease subunit